MLPVLPRFIYSAEELGVCQEKAGGKEKSLQTCRRVHETSGKANVQIGPLQLILECFERLQGWVVGSSQEASQDLHALLACLVGTKL